MRGGFAVITSVMEIVVAVLFAVAVAWQLAVWSVPLGLVAAAAVLVAASWLFNKASSR